MKSAWLGLSLDRAEKTGKTSPKYTAAAVKGTPSGANRPGLIEEAERQTVSSCLGACESEMSTLRMPRLSQGRPAAFRQPQGGGWAWRSRCRLAA